LFRRETGIFEVLQGGKDSPVESGVVCDIVKVNPFSLSAKDFEICPIRSSSPWEGISVFSLTEEMGCADFLANSSKVLNRRLKWDTPLPARSRRRWSPRSLDETRIRRGEMGLALWLP